MTMDNALNLLTQPLVAPVVLPLAAGVVCLLIPRRAERARAWLAVTASAATLALVWPLFAAPDAMLDVGVWLSLRSDALSGFVALATALFGIVVALYSLGYMQGHERHRQYFAYLLWTLGIAVGAVLANDLITLLVCWGLLALTLYLMIGIAGPDAGEAARKSLLIVAGSDALLVFGAVVLWSFTGSPRMDAGPVPLQGFAAHAAFLTFVIAAFAKAGAVPFHTWVPDCAERADAPVSAFLPASLDKLLGIYLLTRCVVDLFAVDAVMSTLLMALGAITVIAAVMLALVQHDLKRLLGYHAVSQVGYMVLGIGTGTPVGVAGGLFHMLNHAIYKCCLFLCAGAVEKAAGTTDLDRLGGLGRSMPITLAVCAIAALAISGIPPLNGFASKWMVYQGIISASDGGVAWVVWLVAAMLGSALTLASFVKVLHATFLCKPSPALAARSVREVGVTMLLPMILLAALCVLFGVFAYAMPLAWFIFPAVPAQPPGVWWAGPATLLILIAIGLGALIYWLTMKAGKLRRVETYVGGERLDEVYIRGEAPGPGRHVEVTGVDFYRTVEQLPVLRRLYALARDKAFDIYHVGGRSVLYFVAWLRAAHTGALPMYLTWFLIGVLLVIYAIAMVGR